MKSEPQRLAAALFAAGQLQTAAGTLDVEVLEKSLREREAKGEGPEFYLQALRNVLSFAAAVRRNQEEHGHQREPLSVVFLGNKEPVN